MRPNVATACAMMARQSSGLLTSATTVVARRPAATTSATVSSASCFDPRYDSTRSMPRAASACATTRPMRLPPVMIATLPVSSMWGLPRLSWITRMNHPQITPIYADSFLVYAAAASPDSSRPGRPAAKRPGRAARRGARRQERSLWAHALVFEPHASLLAGLCPAPRSAPICVNLRNLRIDQGSAASQSRREWWFVSCRSRYWRSSS